MWQEGNIYGAGQAFAEFWGAMIGMPDITDVELKEQEIDGEIDLETPTDE